ncbi:unnamed protein product [Diatraea saccharalis]|uniref:Uncharacterized protein n=1 Tax=Diatraea saccharalis TaxID=40085 RepID=A0A9N9R442_9NEOP|nr:unnamed protein product [Diatraea saccharalis]
MSLDGNTSGPKEYSGPIGKQLAICENKPLASFCAVADNVPKLSNNIMKELSTDQKYLYEKCHAVMTGSCSPKLANRQPGKKAHSRWLTTANRILRFYNGELFIWEDAEDLYQQYIYHCSPLVKWSDELRAI